MIEFELVACKQNASVRLHGYEPSVRSLQGWPDTDVLRRKLTHSQHLPLEGSRIRLIVDGKCWSVSVMDVEHWLDDDLPPRIYIPALGSLLEAIWQDPTWSRLEKL